MSVALPGRPLAKPKKHLGQERRRSTTAAAEAAAAAKYNFRFGYTKRVRARVYNGHNTISARSDSRERNGNSRICKLPFRIKFIHRFL